jgi:probable HAF family extracellular repeat protein
MPTVRKPWAFLVPLDRCLTGDVYDSSAFPFSCTFANAINPAGQVVGLSYLPGNEVFHAFLWENGVMTELISLDRRFASHAAAINPAGEIVGSSTTERGTRSTLWRRK